ncbi:hypothetical protein FGE05_26645 [Pseudomonas sp. ICMP22404]|uniref:hypothetical protein n=1 Tax=Pseudomonas TaxID=286 RepID=UPI0011180D52|nr:MULTISPECIES: hypothetical protein [Pseudomonas]MCI0994505.1 hypothetical protein [Pseudomonas corrugata]NUT69094.1 hypothetical protein [Pseudomonas corrugata]TNF79139.1 hypothetical protein FGE05_26645 [Pseudomonas sp. ICMP22404]
MNDIHADARQGALLPPPSVMGMEQNAVLDPESVPQGAQVTVPRDGLIEGDIVWLTWADTAGGVTAYTDEKPYSRNDIGKPLFFIVPQAQVRRFLELAVTLTYEVEHLAGGDNEHSEDFGLRIAKLPLPMPIIVQAKGDQLNPEDLSSGATLRIAPEAWLKSADVVQVTLAGAAGTGSTVLTHSVLPSEAGGALYIDIPYTVISANEGRSIVLTYTVNGGEPGPEARYEVKRDIGSGEIRVMGARYNRGLYRCSGCSRRLSAFQTSTGRPVLVQWQYEGDDGWVAGTTFQDRDSSRPLHVRSTDYQVTLNPGNIFGSGLDGVLTGDAAFIARRDIGDLVGWGNDAEGAKIPATIISMDDIAEVSATMGAYAARRVNGNVVTWGMTTHGATMGGVPRTGFTQVVGNGAAFAGIRDGGQLAAWGDAASGGLLPEPVEECSDIVKVCGGSLAFAALRSTGQVLAWGAVANGGELGEDIGQLDDVEEVIGNYAAFAALRGNHRLVAWGGAEQGGTLPQEIAYRDDVIELSCATAQAFVARCASGHVIAWGAATHGGVLPELIQDLDDIIEVTSNWQSFVARRKNGHVVAWGTVETGGEVSDEIARMNDIVQVTGSSKAFAALRNDGSVVAWGDVTVGGDVGPVAGVLVNVRAIYGNSHGFTALTADGRMVTWGHAAGGGDSEAVQSLLQGRVSYYRSRSESV